MFWIFAIIGLGLLVSYAIRLTGFRNAWEFNYGTYPPRKQAVFPSVSIIVAGKNEEKSIHKCLDSLVEQSYPQGEFEVIFIDDHSDDNSLSLARQIDHNRLKIIESSDRSGKKYALQQAIERSENSYFLFTDADSFPPSTWLESMMSFLIENECDVVTGPVQYETEQSTLGDFQYFDGINNMALTHYGIREGVYFLANGANLLYKKAVFEAVNGFEDNKNLASGDDVFLVQQAALQGFKVGYNRSDNGIVKTTSEKSWEALLQQRKRWATKTRSYPQKGLQSTQVLVGSIAVFIIVLVPLSALWGKELIALSIVLFLIKHVIDRRYLYAISNYFPEPKKRRLTFKASFIYLMYILYSGFHAMFPSEYKWKGNKVN